ncbi:MAG: cytochrome c-type biogenesis CcmF C-terminal domain-containing protein, partial [Pseudomonadota bacterium]
LVLNNILLTVSCATVLIGTLYPLALEAVTGDKISVGAPYFDLTFGALMIPLLIAMPFGPALAWKRGDLAAAMQRLFAIAAVTVFLTILAYAFLYRGPWLAPVGLGLGVWVMLASIYELGARAKVGSVAPAVAWSRFKGLPRSVFGTAVAHFGVGLMTVGIVATSAYRAEKIEVMSPGETVALAGYVLRFDGATAGRGPNYTTETATLSVTRDGSDAAPVVITPEKRRYHAPPQSTSEAGILPAWLGDLYAVLGDKHSDGKSFTVRVYFNPMVRYIWIGALIMFLGGLLSLTDRRLRVGAPRRSTRSTTAVARTA